MHWKGWAAGFVLVFLAGCAGRAPVLPEEGMVKSEWRFSGSTPSLRMAKRDIVEEIVPEAMAGVGGECADSTWDGVVKRLEGRLAGFPDPVVFEAEITKEEALSHFEQQVVVALEEGAWLDVEEDARATRALDVKTEDDAGGQGRMLSFHQDVAWHGEEGRVVGRGEAELRLLLSMETVASGFYARLAFEEMSLVQPEAVGVWRRLPGRLVFRPERLRHVLDRLEMGSGGELATGRLLWEKTREVWTRDLEEAIANRFEIVWKSEAAFLPVVTRLSVEEAFEKIAKGFPEAMPESVTSGIRISSEFRTRCALFAGLRDRLQFKALPDGRTEVSHALQYCAIRDSFEEEQLFGIREVTAYGTRMNARMHDLLPP